MKKLVYLVVLLAFFGCKSSQESAEPEMAPGGMIFDVERIKSPITGDVPSHLLHQYLPRTMGDIYKNKATKYYPNTWSPVDDRFATLSVSQIVHDPNNTKVYYFSTGEGFMNIGSARGAGIWKSTDAGESWSQLPSTANDSFYFCQDMIVHPVTSDVYVATSNDGVIRSQDGGETWEKVIYRNMGSSRDAAVDLELTADNDIVVAFGILTSGDAIYISSTGDLNDWQEISNGFPTSNIGRIEVATAPSNAQVMYATGYRPSDRLTHPIYKTTDKGQNWFELPKPGGNDSFAKLQAWYDLILQVDPANEDVVIVGGFNVHRSQDGGNTWQQMFEGSRRHNKYNLQYVHVDQHNFIFQDSDTVYITNDGGVWKSNNFTADTPLFLDLNLNYNTSQYYACAIAPQKDNNLVMGGMQDNGSFASTGNGISEFKRVSYADGSFCAIDQENGEYLYSTTQYARMYRTHGNNVDTITNPYIEDGRNGNTQFINQIHMDVNDPQIIYQATNAGLWALFNSRTAKKEEWKQVSNRFGVITTVATSRLAKNTAFVGRLNFPFRVDNVWNGDANNRAVQLDGNAELPSANVFLNCIVPDDQDSNHLVVIYSNYDIISVYETHNAYADDPDWVSCEGNLPNIPVRWGCFKNGSSDVFHVATELGVYSTDKLDGENTVWRDNSSGLPNIRVDQLISRISDDKFVAATHGRGIFTGIADENNDITWTERGPRNVGGRTRTLMIDPNVTSNKKLWAGSVSGGLWVVQNIDSSMHYVEIPESTALDVVPNPASSFVILKFDESNENNIEVEVYNNLGQTLIKREVQSAAEYELSLGGITNGILYIRLKQGDDEVVKKIIKLAE